MSGDTTDADPDPDRQSNSRAVSVSDDAPSAEPLTITLPDGSESVSDAILAHREMLRAPEEHDLATGEDIEHLTEAVESLSGQAQEATRQAEAAGEAVEDLEDVVAHQRRQIRELQSVVVSLAEILGTSMEWQTFDTDEAAPEAAGD